MTHEALGSIVHDSQLEAMLFLIAARQSLSQVIWWQSRLTAVLELCEEGLEEGEEGRKGGREGGTKRGKEGEKEGWIGG